MFFLFVFESSFVELMPVEDWNINRVFVPRFLIIFIIFIAVYHNKIHGFIYGIVFGLLYDIVYTEILGVYMFSMPFICYIISKAGKVLQTNIIIISFLSIVGVIFQEFAVYSINLIIGITDMHIELFLQDRLLPTMILNSIFVILFAYPIKRLLGKLQVSE
nr:rod shape-determining protein MreD [Fredinandcohnia sp. SECRCQ15]